VKKKGEITNNDDDIALLLRLLHSGRRQVHKKVRPQVLRNISIMSSLWYAMWANDRKLPFKRQKSCRHPIKLFELEHVLIPVSGNGHWSLLVVMNAASMLDADDQKKIAIAHIDSCSEEYYDTKKISSRLIE
jgi:Ulp1 family protease